MQQPLIDICVPTCNSNPDFIRRAIKSAQAQTETRWMMHIHDDASRGDTVGSVVRPFLEDERLRWYPNNRKLGIGGNWNASIKQGRAPYVQFLFQDDWWEPWFLEKGLAAMEAHPSIGMVSLHHTYVSEAGDESIPAYKKLEEFRLANFAPGKHDGREVLRWWIEHELHPNIIGEPDFVMLRRSLMDSAGKYLEDMPQNLDVEYSLRCLLEADWYFIKENCGYFRIHDEATSAINQREGKGVFDRFRCFEELLKQLPYGEDRRLTIQARKRALRDMAQKFLARRRQGKSIHASGSSGKAFKQFAIKHPYLVASALLHAWREGNKKLKE